MVALLPSKYSAAKVEESSGTWRGWGWLEVLGVMMSICFKLSVSNSGTMRLFSGDKQSSSGSLCGEISISSKVIASAASDNTRIMERMTWSARLMGGDEGNERAVRLVKEGSCWWKWRGCGDDRKKEAIGKASRHIISHCGVIMESLTGWRSLWHG